MNLAETWSELVDQAMELDPGTIRRSIIATRDDGLRATSYDGPRVMGGTVDSHPERLAMHPPTDHTDADLRLLDSLVASYVSAVAEIAVRSRSGRPCETWGEAVKDHHLLDQMDAVSILERIESPRRWVLKAGDALHDLARLERRHSRRVPDDFDRNHTEVNNATCRNHARIGAVERRVTKILCDWCYRHIGDLELAGLGHAVDLQHDPAMWPSEDMMRSHAQGSRSGVARDRRDWLVARGVDVRQVDRLRSQRRAG